MKMKCDVDIIDIHIVNSLKNESDSSFIQFCEMNQLKYTKKTENHLHDVINELQHENMNHIHIKK